MTENKFADLETRQPRGVKLCGGDQAASPGDLATDSVHGPNLAGARTTRRGRASSGDNPFSVSVVEEARSRCSASTRLNRLKELL
ncbi:hypothetical protein [Schumannella sp. 10F1B-5-1]|uniref:hypothetical protein n=1 Tax=Schumannella sp. 10F1B-5-1 TaxID=2590780 RepID=UPI0015E87120|nr:hypothetical protein [Schumannella sp. 10F1B-5-1]